MAYPAFKSACLDGRPCERWGATGRATSVPRASAVLLRESVGGAGLEPATSCL